MPLKLVDNTQPSPIERFVLEHNMLFKGRRGHDDSASGSDDCSRSSAMVGISVGKLASGRTGDSSNLSFALSNFDSYGFLRPRHRYGSCRYSTECLYNEEEVARLPSLWRIVKDNVIDPIVQWRS